MTKMSDIIGIVSFGVFFKTHILWKGTGFTTDWHCSVTKIGGIGLIIF